MGVVVIQVSMKSALRDRLSAAARQEGVSTAEYVRKALEERLERRPSPIQHPFQPRNGIVDRAWRAADL